MIAFSKTKEPYGWLGNMSPHKVTHLDRKLRVAGGAFLEWKTSEALFQALRFDTCELSEDNKTTIREVIRAAKSPMTAKMIAKKYAKKMIVEPTSVQDLENMELCLHLKAFQNKELFQKLVLTKDAEIVEDVTKRQNGRNKFWGAALIDGKWIGGNNLGKLWMKIRQEIYSIKPVGLRVSYENKEYVVEKDYGFGVYRIGNNSEFIDMVSTVDIFPLESCGHLLNATK